MQAHAQRPLQALACSLVITGFVALGTPVWGQSGSLLRSSGSGNSPLTIDRASWTYQPPPEPRTLREHDLITVLVDEKTQVLAEGEMDRRKQTHAKFTLKDWVLLRAWNLIPDPQSAGDPTIYGDMENKYRAQSDLESREAMKLRVACEVVDVRPNGNLVIEGRRIIQVNDDTWEISLIGTIDPEAILPDNTILSENVANLRLIKREAGHVRDGYRRGWMTRWIDKYQPF